MEPTRSFNTSTSDTEASKMSSEEERKKVMDLFAEMGAKPKGDTPDELRAWMKEYLDSQDEVRGETGTETPRRVQGAAEAGRLRLSVTFSGDETAKGDCKYDLWRYEVDCLIQDGTHSEETLRHVIRRSLKGDAAHVLKRMRANPSVPKILEKFDTVYGIVETGEESLSEFYSARQRDTEDVSAWGCRLEELLDRAVNAGVVRDRDTDEMLRKRFWAGLRLRLKEASRHKFDTITDFDRLRVVVRSIAQEYKQEEELQGTQLKEVKKTAKMATAKEEDESKSYKELKGMVCKLASSVEAIQVQLKGMQQGQTPSTQATMETPKEKKQEEKPTAERKPFACFNCGDPTHPKSECPLLPECYKCHKRGHVQKYCHLNRK